MRIEVQRAPALGRAVMSRLLIDGVFECFSMERADTLIPEGTYPLTLTFSQRCCDAILWSPDDDPAYALTCPWQQHQHRLLLVNNVPGRSGIRIHAANDPDELDGCTAVGRGNQQVRLTLSRVALAQLMSRVVPTLPNASITYCKALV